MSGSEELPNSEEIEVEGVEGADGAEGGEGMEEYDDEEIAQMQKDLAKAEQQKAELEKLQKMQGGGAATPEKPDNAERDSRSIFIGNVDFSCSVEEVQELFRDCGEINAITIPVDKHTGRAKGFAYLEFADKASILAALEKNNSLLHDRPIKVVNKRTNLPIWQVIPTRGRGTPRGRGRGFVPRGRGGRGRGRGHYHPYY